MRHFVYELRVVPSPVLVASRHDTTVPDTKPSGRLRLGRARPRRAPGAVRGSGVYDVKEAPRSGALIIGMSPFGDGVASGH